MPFKSQAQRGYFYKFLPHLAKKWEKHTPKGKLPYKVREAVIQKLIERGIINEQEMQRLRGCHVERQRPTTSDRDDLV